MRRPGSPDQQQTGRTRTMVGFTYTKLIYVHTIYLYEYLKNSALLKAVSSTKVMYRRWVKWGRAGQFRVTPGDLTTREGWGWWGEVMRGGRLVR